MPDGENGGLRFCYGRFDSREECGRCGVWLSCCSFTESERALAVGRSRIVGIPEWIPAADTAEPLDEEPIYTEEDMLKVIGFFLTLSAEEIQILQIRLLKPAVAITEIAKKLKIDRKKIYEFFRRETEALPELEKLLYRRAARRRHD